MRLPLAAASVLALACCAVADWPTTIPTIPWQLELSWDKMIATSNVTYLPVVAEQARYVVGNNASLPPQVNIERSNNCVGITSFNNTLFMGWRSAPYHFASADTRMYITSSLDGGFTWAFEHLIQLGTDVREPHFLVFKNQLVFSFFQAGVDPLAFEPKAMYHMRYFSPGNWSQPEVWGQPEEIPWQLGVFNGTAYTSSYVGNHYSLTNRPNISVFLNESTDGWNWQPVSPDAPVVYQGGVSEVGWAFDLSGTFTGVLRNEDGDDSGWGSRIATAASHSLGDWALYPKNESDPYIYESSRMFRHGNDLYLVARRDPNQPYWDKGLSSLPWELQHDINLATYSLRSHRTSLFKVLPDGLHLYYDIPGCGDTAFPSILRVSEHEYIIVNYTSPVDECADWPWIEGQISSDGTQIYFLLLQFQPA